jgi:beta-glucosidase
VFNVDVLIQGAQNLGGFEFDLAFDPAVLEVQGATIGDLLGSTGRTVGALGPLVNGAAGTAASGAYSYGSPPGPNGNGKLVRLTIRAMAKSSSTTLRIENILLADLDGHLTIAQPDDATLGITGCRADADGDGDVDIRDVALVFAHWPSPPLAYDARYDVDGDGDIDIRDVALVFGQWPSPPKTCTL